MRITRPRMGLIFGAATLTWVVPISGVAAAEPAAVYDGFAYSPDRPLLGQNRGSGWAGPWGQHGPGGRTEITAASLSFGNLLTSGGAAVTTSEAPVGNPRPLAREYGVTGTTVYFGLLVQPLSPVAGKYLGFGVGNLHVGKGPGDLRYGIERAGGGGFVASPVEAVQEKTTLLVVRATFKQGNDRVELWVDPKPGRALPETPDAVKEDTDLGRSATGGFGADTRCVFDEWRIGSTFEAVCPVKGLLGQDLVVAPPPDKPVKPEAARKLDSALVKAAGAGDLDLVRELISKGADPNAWDDMEGESPLTAAVGKQRLPVVKELLARGAKVEVPVGLHDTPLQRAVETGSPDLFAPLLDRGGEVNERTVSGYTLLMRAALHGKVNMVKYLITLGARVNDVDDQGTTALMNAVSTSAQELESIRHLLAAGADPNLRDKQGRTALTFARHDAGEEFGRQALALLEKAGAKLPERYLLVATAEGDLEEVRKSLARGEDPNQVNADGAAPLDFAITGPVEIAAALLDKGARLDFPLGKGDERLFLVAEYGKPEMLSLLLSRGLDAGRQDDEGRTLLMLAARSGQVGNMKVLLARGLNPNARGPGGLTAAFYALGHWLSDFEDGKKALELLLERGASANAVARPGITMLALAVMDENEEMVRLLVGRGADPNRFGPEECNPLTFAASEGNADLVRLLLSKGARPNPVTRSGLTPLRAALEGGHRTIVRMLQSAGARQ